MPFFTRIYLITAPSYTLLTFSWFLRLAIQVLNIGRSFDPPSMLTTLSNSAVVSRLVPRPLSTSQSQPVLDLPPRFGPPSIGLNLFKICDLALMVRRRMRFFPWFKGKLVFSFAALNVLTFSHHLKLTYVSNFCI